MINNVISFKRGMIQKIKLLVLFATIIAALGTINSASALTYEDTVVLQFTWNPSISINVSGDLLIPNLTPGSSSDSNIITITAGSNDANGYTLYSNVGNSTSNYTDLRISPSNSTNKFTNLSSNKANLAAFADNTWGYSYCNATSNASACDTTSNWVSGSVGSTSAGYNGLPLYNSSNNATGIILADTTTANQTTLKFKIGAKAATSQASGLYTNVVNFTSVAKVVTTSYTLSYVDNSSEATGMPSSSTTGTTTNGAFNVTSTVPSRTNYTFKGWCTVNNSSDPTTCTGTLIQPSGLYAIGSSTTTFTGSVYATWQSLVPPVTFDESYAAAGKTKTNNYYTMQDMTNSICAAVTTGQTGTVIDPRNNSTYRVGKLEDGNCWMLDNLALDLTNSTVQSNLTSSTTNASDTTLNYLINGGGTTSDKYPTAKVNNVAWTSGSQNYYSIPMIASSGTCYDDYCVNGGSAGSPWSYSDSTSVTINGVTSIAQGKIGIYYNYCAASAGSYCWGNGTYNTGSPSSDPDTTTLQDVKEDICPAGWHLPTGTGSGQFIALYRAYNNNSTNFQTALSTPLSGDFGSGEAYEQGNSGHFWSSTWCSTFYMYSLSVHPSGTSLYSDSNELRFSGVSARCIYGS